MTPLWLKALHLFFIIAWFAGIFYLPRLYVYHAQTEDPNVKAMFNVMQRRLWWFVFPFALLTAVFGIALIVNYGRAWFAASMWLHIKLVLVILIYAYYGYLYLLMRRFAQGINHHSPRFYRFLNEAPVIVLLAIVVLAVLKPGI